MLTAQELEELKAQCRSYCDDLDPHSTLNAGALTLTKIKDIFAIMKNLVLESRQQQQQQLGASGSAYGANQSSSGGSSSSSSGNSGGGVSEAEAQAEIDNLKSLLFQRDNEISILVNMVKQGKTVEDVGSAMLRSAGSSRNQHRSSDASISRTSSSTPQNPGAAQGRGAGAGAVGGMSAQALQEAQQMQREKQKEERIVKRHLFGVPPPNDKAIFDDAAGTTSPSIT